MCVFSVSVCVSVCVFSVCVFCVCFLCVCVCVCVFGPSSLNEGSSFK